MRDKTRLPTRRLKVNDQSDNVRLRSDRFTAKTVCLFERKQKRESAFIHSSTVVNESFFGGKSEALPELSLNTNLCIDDESRYSPDIRAVYDHPNELMNEKNKLSSRRFFSRALHRTLTLDRATSRRTVLLSFHTRLLPLLVVSAYLRSSRKRTTREASRQVTTRAHHLS